MIMENTQVATTKGNGLAHMPGAQVLKEDLELGRLILVQGNNVLKKNLGAKDGDIVNTLTDQIVAGVGKSIELIPLFSVPIWSWFYTDGKKEWVKSEARTANHPAEWDQWEFKVVHEKRFIKPSRALVLTALPKGEVLPVTINIKKSGYKAAAKKIETLKAMLGSAGKPFYSQSILLSTAEASWEGNPYLTFKVAFGGDSSKEEMEKAEVWIKQFSSTPMDVSDITDHDEKGA